MYDEGYKSIANIDISKVVVDQMTEKYRDKTGLTCTLLLGRDLRLKRLTQASVGQGNT